MNLVHIGIRILPLLSARTAGYIGSVVTDVSVSPRHSISHLAALAAVRAHAFCSRHVAGLEVHGVAALEADIEADIEADFYLNFEAGRNDTVPRKSRKPESAAPRIT
jgi:hypothetical protein